jgi:hypothetical protein
MGPPGPMLRCEVGRRRRSVCSQPWLAPGHSPMRRIPDRLPPVKDGQVLFTGGCPFRHCDEPGSASTDAAAACGATARAGRSQRGGRRLICAISLIRRETPCGGVRPSPVLFRRPATRSTINGVITRQAPQPSRSHRKRAQIRPLTKGLLTALAAVGLALIPAITIPALLSAASPPGKTRPTQTVTVKASVPPPARKPVHTVTVTRPGPTITVTVLQPGPTVTIRCHSHGRGCGPGNGEQQGLFSRQLVNSPIRRPLMRHRGRARDISVA